MRAYIRVAKNFSWLLASEAVSKLLGFFITLVVARYLGSAGFGKFSFAFSFAYLFLIFVNFGLNLLAVREIARNYSLAPKILGNMLFLKMVLSALVFFALLAFSPVIPHASLVFLAALAMFVGSFVQLFNSVFLASEKMEYAAVITVTEKSARLALVLAAVNLHASLELIIALSILSNLSALFVSLFFLKTRFVLPSFRIDFRLLRRFLSEAWPFALNSVFAAIYFRIDTVMLSFFRSDSVVGWYNAASLLVSVSAVVPSMLARAVFPVVSRKHADRRYSSVVLSKSLRAALLAALPVGAFLILFSRVLIRFVFGTAFLHASGVLAVLACNVVPLFMNIIVFNHLYASGRQLDVTRIAFFGMIVNVLLNSLLIPPFGFFGAAVATIGAHFVMASVSVFSLRK